MAKKKYKTHEQLGITFAEWGALWGFKAIAEAGIVLQSLPRGYGVLDAADLLSLHPGAHFFDMNTPCWTKECGSVACIGGTVALFCQMKDPGGYVLRLDPDSRSPLASLYFPQWNNGREVDLRRPASHDGRWSRITPAMAAVAVDNFLRTGKPNWDKAIPKALRRSR